MSLVALFGTSANPPTGEGGHRSILEWLARARLPEVGNRTVDEIWVLPVQRHVFAEKAEMPAFHHRVAMARLAFGDLLKVRVLPLEAELARRVDRPATVDLVEALQQHHPEFELVLVLGGDTWADLEAGRWRRGQELRELLPIVVVQRPGESDGSGLDVEELEEVSSTQARTHDLAGVPGPVAAYAETHGLYRTP